jgi:hypothetical protein
MSTKEEIRNQLLQCAKGVHQLDIYKYQDNPPENGKEIVVKRCIICNTLFLGYIDKDDNWIQTLYITPPGFLEFVGQGLLFDETSGG